MYQNIFLQVQNLRRPSVIKAGGLCRIYIAKHEDVETWPTANPANGGILDSAIELRVGGTFYIIEATKKERSLKEKTVFTAEGPAVEITVTASLAGNTPNNTLGLAAMLYHKYVLICEDHDGIKRLVGNQDCGAKLEWDFDSGSQNSSRYRNLKWTWLHSLSAPIYDGGGIISDITQIYSSLTLLAEFEVEEGAPMEDTQTTYINALLAGRNFIMFADGIYIPQIVNPGFRYCQKTFGSDTITVNGGVTEGEIISIYLIS